MLGLLKRLFGNTKAPPENRSPLAPEYEQPAPKLSYRVYTREFDLELSADDIPPPYPRRYRKGPPAPQELAYLLEHIHTEPAFQARAKASWAAWRDVLQVDSGVLITLLVDHSGSMRGQKSRQALTVIEAISTVLDGINANYEVLGFTTSTWHGGSSRGRWLRAGGNPLPGRLCDLLHIVYKSVNGCDENWRRGLSTLLDDDKLKENVDGEALLWAHARAQAFRPNRWLCIVISDGAPVDDSTLMYNEPDILTHHLDEVVGGFIQRPDVQLGAVILGPLDWNTPYAKQLLLLPEQEVGEIIAATFEFLDEILGSLGSSTSAPN